MLWFDKVVVILNSVMEITGVLLLIHTLCASKEPVSYAKIAVFYAAMISYISWINLFVENQQIFFISYFVLFLYVEWQYEIPVMQGILTVVTSIVIATMLELVFFVPYSLLSRIHVPDSVLSLLVVVGMLVVILLLKDKIPVEEIKKRVLSKEKYSLVVVIICSVVVVYAIVTFSSNNVMSFSEYFYVISCATIIVLSFYKLNQYRCEAKLRAEYSDVYGEVLQQIRERQHKFTNQLNAVYALHHVCKTYDELVERQEEQTNELKKYIMPNNVIILKDPIVVAHVYQKICEAADQEIPLETTFDCDIGEADVPDIYLVEMIGTLFDNAMESILSASEEGKPKAKMYLSITMRDEEITIEVKNEHEYIPFSVWNQFFERGYSTKGEGRGLGLHHLKSLVKKYDGEIRVENKEELGSNYFSISIILKASH
ncbi:MAG: GHKL domain-containing protein [Roseburia sp.]|nr:GHKL domain-containing protein [Roseburia sp.]